MSIPREKEKVGMETQIKDLAFDGKQCNGSSVKREGAIRMCGGVCSLKERRQLREVSLLALFLCSLWVSSRGRELSFV